MRARVPPTVAAVVLGVVALNAAIPVLLKDVLPHLPALPLLLWKQALSCALVLPFVRPGLPRDPRLAALLALNGALGAVNSLLLYWGAPLTRASHVGMAWTLVPVLTAALGAALGLERIRRATLAALALGVGGALLAVRFEDTPGGDATVSGDALVLASVTANACAVVLTARLVERAPPGTVLFWTLALGTVAVLPFCARPTLAVDPASLPVGAALAAGIIGTTYAITVGARTWAVKRVTATTFAFGALLLPPLTALLAWLRHSDVPALRTLAGMALVMAAAALVLRAPSARM